MTETRFGFGKNWSRFLDTLTDERIAVAEQSIRDSVGRSDLRGMRLLDLGSGSGLFSLAARRLGADVTSFDYDADSVACTELLRDRHFPQDASWKVSRGSALDEAWMRSLGEFDVVYSWGVLHHTGAMWNAIGGACDAVKPGGILLISIYNDQGWRSGFWKSVKRTYSRSHPVLRPLIASPFFAWFGLKSAVFDLLHGRFLSSIRNYQSNRGMSWRHDVIDWVGGYPFEVATPEAIFEFCRSRGFTHTRLRTVRGSMGCNEFVFVRKSEEPA